MAPDCAETSSLAPDGGGVIVAAVVVSNGVDPVLLGSVVACGATTMLYPLTGGAKTVATESFTMVEVGRLVFLVLVSNVSVPSSPVTVFVLVTTASTLKYEIVSPGPAVDVH
jgi:hypothetical protein